MIKTENPTGNCSLGDLSMEELRQTPGDCGRGKAGGVIEREMIPKLISIRKQRAVITA